MWSDSYMQPPLGQAIGGAPSSGGKGGSGAAPQNPWASLLNSMGQQPNPGQSASVQSEPMMGRSSQTRQNSGGK